MIYLNSFKLLNISEEHDVTLMDERNIYNNYYPLNIFTMKDLENITFENITIFYGGNGSGKSTLLNVIASKLSASSKHQISKGRIFDNYVSLCKYDMSFSRPDEIKIITSNDVFDYLLDIRSINAHVDRQKEQLSKEYLSYKFTEDTATIEQYEILKKRNATRSQTMSKYIRTQLTNNNIVEQSNGQSALMFWEQEIKENSIYILDEPENSLSAENQLKLKQFIEDSARFYNCQFIISTHSPFLLNLLEAKIYDLDSYPVKTKKWTELDAIKIYHDFFKEHDSEF